MSFMAVFKKKPPRAHLKCIHESCQWYIVWHRVKYSHFIRLPTSLFGSLVNISENSVYYDHTIVCNWHYLLFIYCTVPQHVC